MGPLFRALYVLSSSIITYAEICARIITRVRRVFPKCVGNGIKLFLVHFQAKAYLYDKFNWTLLKQGDCESMKMVGNLGLKIWYGASPYLCPSVDI